MSPLLSRRQAGQAAGALIACLLLPVRAWATPPQAEQAIATLRAGRQQMGDGLIILEAPEIAENGNTVPIGVQVLSPMLPSDYVEKIHLISPENPLATIASFSFSPAAGVAHIRTRIRLAKTQTLYTVAQFSGQRVAVAAHEIKVTIGGCGGG